MIHTKIFLSLPVLLFFFVLFSESVFILRSGVVFKPIYILKIFQCQNSHLAAASALAKRFPVYPNANNNKKNPLLTVCTATSYTAHITHKWESGEGVGFVLIRKYQGRSGLHCLDQDAAARRRVVLLKSPVTAFFNYRHTLRLFAARTLYYRTTKKKRKLEKGEK